VNTNILEGKWKQVSGQTKLCWRILTDEDLESVDGHFDKLVVLLQEKYIYTQQQVKEELEKRTK